MNISKSFAPAFPAWCATLEKLRIDYGLNCKKQLKEPFFAIKQLVITTYSADMKVRTSLNFRQDSISQAADRKSEPLGKCFLARLPSEERCDRGCGDGFSEKEHDVRSKVCDNAEQIMIVDTRAYRSFFDSRPVFHSRNHRSGGLS